MNAVNELTMPLSDGVMESLKAGEMYYLSGDILTGRDAAHKRLFDMINEGRELPVDLAGQLIFYAGPCPAKPGQVIGSVGPTTSGRMDAYSPLLIEKGLRLMLGKGYRSQAVTDAIVKHKGVYFVAIGGAAALMATKVKKAEVVAFEDLGTEAIRRLTVERLPVIVAIDSRGVNCYEQGIEKYKQI